MDERLVAQFDWSKQEPPPHSLCLYAVLLARTDLERPTASTNDEFLNIRLARILQLGFQSDLLIALKEWDVMDVLARLNQSLPPRRIVHVAKHIGDQALFVTSQNTKLGRSVLHGPSLRAISGLGRQAYHVAACNLARSTEQESEHYVLHTLANEFPTYQHLLERAGHVLGFDCDIATLWSITTPPVTIDDALEALSRFSANPTIANWENLVDLVERCRWNHPEFLLTLPPRPDA